MGSLTKTVFGDAREVFIDRRGFAYYPLLTDGNVEQEAARNREIRKLRNKIYIKGMNLNSAIANFEKIDKEKYETIKNELFSSIIPNINLENIHDKNDYEIIRTIIFEVMPYFTGKNEKCGVIEKTKQKTQTEHDILAMINDKTKIPEQYYSQAKRVYNVQKIKETLEKLKSHQIKRGRFPKGLIETKALEFELYGRIEADILGKKRGELEKDAKLKKEIIQKSLDYAATMLYLKDAKDFELDNFGFIRKSKDDYIAYVKTGEYALRDFDRKVYLFPPCKVGVHVSNNLYSSCGDPIILGKYRHPFLGEYSYTDQPMCIVRRKYENCKGGEKIIKALETGLNTLLFGYFKSRAATGHRLIRLDNFPEKQISENNPRIKSGKVPITNDPFIKSKKGDDK